MTITPFQYERLLYLLANSDGYCIQDAQWIYDYIQVPITLGKFITDPTCSYFATFATPDWKELYIYQKYWVLDPDAFMSNGHSMWIIDLVVDGDFNSLIRTFRQIKLQVLSMGYNECYWLRDKNGRIGFHRHG